MAEAVERQRTVIRAPRVEFDLSALVLGAVGWLAYQWSWPALASLLSVPDGKFRAWDALRNQFFGKVLGKLGLPFTDHVGALVGAQWPMLVPPAKAGDPVTAYVLDLQWWKYAVVAAWLLVLWSLVAGAISRVYAVRIARDESIGASEGLAFSFSNLRAFLQAPLFVAGAAALFLAAAALAGAASAVPTVGPFLQAVLQPLAYLAALVVVVIAIGGVFGFPLMQAALATERNGTLDAISRTFSYVFTKPVLYIASCSIVVLVASVIAAFGGAVIGVVQRAMMFGAQWNADPSAPLDARRAIGDGISFGASDHAVLGWPKLVERVQDVPHAWIYVSWGVTVLAALVVHGWVLSYFVGGLTDTYFLLRREVDGIDDGEVYTEGAEATLGEPVAGEPSAAGRNS
jgi:hypothetical protein